MSVSLVVCCVCSELKRRLKAQKKTEEKQEKLAAVKQQAVDTHKAEASVAEEDIDPHVRFSACSCVLFAR